MKICLIGDPHFANRKAFGTTLDVSGSVLVGGANRRLRAVTETIEYIAEGLPDEVEHVMIMGDITHDHGVLTPPVQNEILHCLDQLMLFDRQVHLLTGNHDIDAHGLSILRGFERRWPGHKSSVTVYEHPTYWLKREEFEFHIIPYCSHGKTIDALARIGEEDQPSIIFMHHHFDGAVHGTHEYTPPGGLHPTHIPDNVVQIYTGHYHKCHKLMPNIQYVGTPLQHDFGESTYAPCYHIVDFEDGEIERTTYIIPEHIAPRFHILDHNHDPNKLPGDLERDYYRIDWPTDEVAVKAKALAEQLTNVVIHPVPVLAAVRSRVEEHLKTKKGERVDLEGVIDAYAALHTKGDKYTETLDLGLEIARSVLDEQD